MKIVLLGLVGVLLFVALVGGIWAYRWTIAPTRGTVEQREITNRGQYRVQAYEQFYRWYEQREALRLKLEALPQTDLDRREQTECRGLLAQYADITARYNAAAATELTQGQWQDPELPQRLPNANLRGCG